MGAAFVDASERIVIIRGMRNFLVTLSIVFALFVSAAGTAHAQDFTQATVDPAVDYAAQANTDAASTPLLKTDSAAANTPITQPGKLDPSQGFDSVMIWIMSLFAWLVGVAAITLDNVVYYTVVTMGDYVHKLSAVGVTWRILRDLGNIMLIFGFLAAGIATILNVDMYG